MTADRPAQLVRLGDTVSPVDDQYGDIRGRWVIDRNGDEIGYVDALLIDDLDRRVRFLLIMSGGIPGSRTRRLLVPVDAVIDVDDDQAVIDQTGERVFNAPSYDPALAYDRAYYHALYLYYGYSPYWRRGDT